MAENRVNEKKLRETGTQFVKADSVSYNYDSTASSGALTAEVPTIRDSSRAYVEQYSDMLGAMYRVGRTIYEVNEKAEQEIEQIRVNGEIYKLRKDFIDNYDNQEVVNFSSDKWNQEREKAWERLKEDEGKVLSDSILHNDVLRQNEARNDRFYEESEIAFTLKKAEWQKQSNIDTFYRSLNHSIMMLPSARNRAEQLQIIDNMNASKRGLLKYDIPEGKIDDEIVQGVRDIIKMSNASSMSKIFRNATIENLGVKVAEAQATVENSVSSSMALLNGIEGFAEKDAYKVAEVLIGNSVSEAEDYISEKIEAVKYKAQLDADRAERAQDRAEYKAGKELEKRTSWYKTDADYQASNNVIGLLAHRGSKAEGFTITDLAYDETIEKDLNKFVYGEHFTLEKQGEENNYSIGHFIDNSYISDYRKEIQNAIDIEQVMAKTDAYAEKLVGNTGEYNVSPEKKAKVLKGIKRELLYKTGYDPKILEEDPATNKKIVDRLDKAYKDKNVKVDEFLNMPKAVYNNSDSNWIGSTRQGATGKAVDVVKAKIKAESGALIDDDMAERLAREFVVSKSIDYAKNNKDKIAEAQYDVIGIKGEKDVYGKMQNMDKMVEQQSDYFKANNAELNREIKSYFRMRIDRDKFDEKPIRKGSYEGFYDGKNIKSTKGKHEPLVRENSGYSVDKINNIIASATKGSSPLRGKGSAFLEASSKTGIHPLDLIAHAIHETGRGGSNILNKKGNPYGIGAFDDSPMASAYAYDSVEDGIIRGAEFIKVNYVDKGQDTLHAMNHGGENGHNWSTDPNWDEKISNIRSELEGK